MLKSLRNTLIFVAIMIGWIILLVATRPLFINDSYFGSTFTALGLIVMTCIITPMWEELIFRYVPVMLTKKIKKNTGYDYTHYAILIASYIFAIGHNNGIYSIILQGTIGVGLCYLFIINGYKYWWNVIAHSAWNLSVLFLFPALGL